MVNAKTKDRLSHRSLTRTKQTCTFNAHVFRIKNLTWLIKTAPILTFCLTLNGEKTVSSSVYVKKCKISHTSTKKPYITIDALHIENYNSFSELGELERST